MNCIENKMITEVKVNLIKDMKEEYVKQIEEWTELKCSNMIFDNKRDNCTMNTPKFDTIIMKEMKFWDSF